MWKNANEICVFVVLLCFSFVRSKAFVFLCYCMLYYALSHEKDYSFVSKNQDNKVDLFTMEWRKCSLLSHLPSNVLVRKENEREEGNFPLKSQRNILCLFYAIICLNSFIESVWMSFSISRLHIFIGIGWKTRSLLSKQNNYVRNMSMTWSIFLFLLSYNIMQKHKFNSRFGSFLIYI